MRNERRLLLITLMAGLMSLAINAQTRADSVAAVVQVQKDSVAADFSMETTDRQVLRLSQLPTARQTLLMFYDPDCTDCRQELFAMRHSSSLRRAVQQGRVQVVCVYAEQDEALWRETAAALPRAWTIAKACCAEEVHHHYDLSAMPLLLLLDGNRRILQQAYEFSELSILP